MSYSSKNRKEKDKERKNLKKIRSFLKKIFAFENTQEKSVNIKDLLKEQAIELLENLTNYSTNYNSSDVLFCKLCEKKIEDSISLILWNKDREHYISFHFPCALKEGTADLFYELMSTFDYIYPIEPILPKKEKKKKQKKKKEKGGNL